MKKQEILSILKQCRSYIRGSEDFGFTPAVYVSPAQQLRNQADEIERKDAFIKKLQTAIQALEEDLTLTQDK